MSNLMPLVSIAIIAYNQQEFIKEAVLSACLQDYANIEVVVSDDGSTDNTISIINDLATQFPDKIKAITGGANVGITGNCNRALALCNGEYLVFMGGDDVLLPEKVIKQVEWFLKSESRVLCGHPMDIINEQSEIISTYKTIRKSGCGADFWIRQGVLFGALSIMVKRNSVAAVDFDSRIKHASDWKFYIDCIGDAGEYGFVDAILGQYRKHENNITRQLDIVMTDADITLSILEEEYPQFSSAVKYSKAYICCYGRGLQAQQSGEKQKSLGLYLQAIKLRPFLFKAYFRVFTLLF